MRWLVIIFALAACARNKNLVEPQLAGGESPAAFQRAIGLTLLKTDQPRRALPFLQRLARLEPTRAEPRCYVSRAFMGMQLWDQAEASLAEAISLDPRHAPAHALLAVVLDTRGDHRAAAAAHRRAIYLDPNNAGYRNNLGFSLYLDGRYVDALAVYQDALRLDPSMQRTHNNLGFALGKLGKLDEASNHFRLGGTVAEATNNLGMVYEERGELERAYEAYAAAVREAPELLAAQGNLKRIGARLGKPLPAIPDRRE